jgi:hypothetical protein
MEQVAGFPFLRLEFDKIGRPNAAQKQALMEALSGELAGFSDLLVVSHGWNNDMAEAQQLYQALLGNMRPRLDAKHPPGSGRRFAVLGIFWPSKKFADAELIPGIDSNGSVAGMGPDELPDSAVRAAADRLGALVDADQAQLDELRRRAESVDQGQAAERAFVDAVRVMLPAPTDGEDDASDLLFEMDGHELIAALLFPVSVGDPDGDQGGIAMLEPGSAAERDAAGAAADLGGFFSGAKAAAQRLLNLATYYVMKERAGLVGTRLNAVLGEVRDVRPNFRIHLIGHSFGARLVTAAADGPRAIAPASLSLLQAAFSHNGFCQDIEGRPGFFRKVVADAKVRGTIIATHTGNDRAVGIAYALASRLSGVNNAFVGGPNDQFGGLGRNGAMRLAPGEHVMATLENGAFPYPPFSEGVVRNLRADAFVSGHSDVANAAVANAVVHAIG